MSVLLHLSSFPIGMQYGDVLIIEKTLNKLQLPTTDAITIGKVLHPNDCSVLDTDPHHDSMNNADVELESPPNVLDDIIVSPETLPIHVDDTTTCSSEPFDSRRSNAVTLFNLSPILAAESCRNVASTPSHIDSSDDDSDFENSMIGVGKTPGLVRHIRRTRIERKLSFHSYKPSCGSSDSDIGRWLQRPSNVISMITYSSESQIVTQDAVFSCLLTSIAPASEKSLYRHHLDGYTLIVTSKANVDRWADQVRSQPNVSLLVYTEGLAKRRKLGVHRLSAYNVVIVTFDVLCAKELVIPEDDLYDSEEEESILQHVNALNLDGISSKWLFRRQLNSVSFEVSQLHMIKWRLIVLDIPTALVLRPGNAKGDAVRALLGDKTIALIQWDDDHEHDDVFASSKQCKELRGVLKLNSSCPTTAVHHHIKA